MRIRSLCLLLGLGVLFAHGQSVQTTPFKHIIVVFQENRTPDNLFQGLLTWPGIVASKYDIQPSGMVGTACKSPQAISLSGATLNTSTCGITGGTQDKRCLEPQPLTGGYDPSHSHCAFISMYDNGKMDGAGFVRDVCHTATNCKNSGAGEFLSYKFVPNIEHRLDPYLQLAADYSWANRMFQTNQGPSFPAHQYLFGGTSAQSATDDKQAKFIAENPGGKALTKYYPGCLSPANLFNYVLSPHPSGSCPPGCTCYENKTMECTLEQGTQHNLCFDHATLASLLDQHKVSWKYYAPSPGSIWNAPQSIKDVCKPDYTTGKCTGADYNNKVDFNLKDVVGDIDDASCTKLASVSWVIPDGQCSDHAAVSKGGGPAWVASIVNAVGQSKCGYWKDTAIVITWDDWGGWYDHVKPPVLTGDEGDYQLGFRVPLIVVSARTKSGTVVDTQLDFGSILRFIEENFGLGAGALGFADNRAHHGLDEFFNQAADKFTPVKAPPLPEFCTMLAGKGVAPDEDLEEENTALPAGDKKP